MRRIARAPVCASCLSGIAPPSAIHRTVAQPWLNQRFFTKGTREKPSRMILSDQVHRAPAHRGGRRESAGPFGSMNRTTANIDPARKAARAEAFARTTDKSGRRNSKQGLEERKALKMQRALASVSYGRRNLTKERMAEYDDFDQFDLLPELKSAITDELFKGMTDIKPTPIQRLAIPAILGQQKPGEPSREYAGHRSFLLAAETGSGKTLSYLLPAVNAVKIEEAEDPDIKAYKERYETEKARMESSKGKGRLMDEPHPTMARPKVVVLVPTAELAQQIGKVSKKLSHVIKYKTEMLSSDLKPQQIQRNIYSPRGLDVIIATPHLLASIADSDPNILSRVSHLIVDEADSLLDRSFSSVTTSIIERAMPSLKALVCCSATIPRKLNNYLAVTYPKMHRITTPNLHAIPRRVQLGVIDVSKEPYRNKKDLACADALYSIGKEGLAHEGMNKDVVDLRRVLVFVNEREKTEQLAEYLRTWGIDAQALHRDTTEKRHDEILETFTTKDTITVPATPIKGRGKLGNVKVLVVTDLASRGIDTLAVRHVILYDVPHTTIDFIHRLGRAGRMGRRGRGIVLVGNDDRKDVVADVKRSMFEGQALI